MVRLVQEYLLFRNKCKRKYKHW